MKINKRRNKSNFIKFLNIKSAGFINNRWQVILDNGEFLGGIQSLELKKDLKNSSIGNLVLNIIIDQSIKWGPVTDIKS